MENDGGSGNDLLTCRAAGSNPTADISDVRPPTQSNMGNLANQPSILAVLSNKEPSCVMATPCQFQESQHGQLVRTRQLPSLASNQQASKVFEVQLAKRKSTSNTVQSLKLEIGTTCIDISAQYHS